MYAAGANEDVKPKVRDSRDAFLLLLAPMASASMVRPTDGEVGGAKREGKASFTH